MIETIEYAGIHYPKFQATGNAARFIIPFAKEVCKGIGYDIGYCKEEWKLPGAVGIDIVNDDGFDAITLPNKKVDYIFSSHCLEHVNNWVHTLDIWLSFIRYKGILFLYLPDHSQGYWSYGNRKHVNIFTPEIIRGYMKDRFMKNIFVSGIDLNNSFAAMAEVG
jgi:hypothetical protein